MQPFGEGFPKHRKVMPRRTIVSNVLVQRPLSCQHFDPSARLKYGTTHKQVVARKAHNGDGTDTTKFEVEN